MGELVVATATPDIPLQVVQTALGTGVRKRYARRTMRRGGRA